MKFLKKNELPQMLERIDCSLFASLEQYCYLLDAIVISQANIQMFVGCHNSLTLPRLNSNSEIQHDHHTHYSNNNTGYLESCYTF